ncbi:hypothetical protein GO730_31310 [Spirosoma sp. HMF3257]|uniref:Uncharacterized protein n=1 Tax=Spirosoma telluris TaxID=2183553 RepID=A0A327NQK4_9BACT|nr:hypothetical protein [Spirosoma telluris]RAI77517.1 hypothetical protein HMF3257_31210 [Spirosoma telluris]
MAYSQSIEPVRGAKVIELTTTLSDTAMYKTIGRILVDEGYTFKADKERLNFQTGERLTPNLPGFRYIAILAIHQGKIKITGLMLKPMPSKPRRKAVREKGKPVAYQTSRDDRLGLVFNQLDELAHALTVPMVTSITGYSKR